MYLLYICKYIYSEHGDNFGIRDFLDISPAISVYIYIYVCVYLGVTRLCTVSNVSNPQYTYRYFYIYIYICLCIYIYICVCVFYIHISFQIIYNHNYFNCGILIFNQITLVYTAIYPVYPTYPISDTFNISNPITIIPCEF